MPKRKWGKKCLVVVQLLGDMIDRLSMHGRQQGEAHRCACTDVLMCNFIGPLELFSSSSAMVWTALKDGLGAEELFHQHQAGQFMGKGHRRQAQLPVGLGLDLLG